MAERKSFLVFCDRLKELEMLSDDECGKLFKALMRYVSTGEEFETNVLHLKLMFSVFKSQIDSNDEKYQKRKEANAEYYKKRKIKTISENSENSENSGSDTDTVTDTVTDTGIITIINDSNNKNKNYIDGGCKGEDKLPRTPTNSTRFAKPTVEDIKTYCQERKNGINAEKFYDYYESNGWKVGKNPMKNWKAAVRTWERSNYSTEKDNKEDKEKFLEQFYSGKNAIDKPF